MTDAPTSIALRLVEGAVWSAARNLLQTALSLVALAVVAREVGPEAYGVFGIAMLVIGIAEMVAGGALTESIVQRKEIEDGHVDATFWLSTISAVGLAVAVALFATPLARLAGGAQAAEVLFVLGCFLPVAVGSRVPMALLARELRFRACAQISALATILSCATGIVLALRGNGIWTLVVMEAMRSGVTLVGAFVAVSWRPGARGSWRQLRELSRFNAGTLVTYTVGYADLLLPRLLVSHLLGAQALGLFLLATRVLTELSNLLIEPLRTVATAACARAQNAREELHRLILGLYRTSRLVVFPAFLGMAVIAPWLIPLLFGPEWDAAVPAIQLLMLGGLRLATGAFNSAILFGVGHVRSTLYLLAAGCVLHLVLFPLLAPKGVTGAAVALLGRQVGSWPLACLLIKRATGLTVRRQIGDAMSILLAATAMASIVWLIAWFLEPRLPIAAVVVASTSIGVIGYAAWLRVLSPATFHTVTALASAFVRRDLAQLESIFEQTK